MRAIQKILGPMALCAVACTFVCCDGGSSEIVIPNTDLSGLFENGDGIESDFENGIIEVPAGVDSLVIDDVSSLGGAHCYLALDDDLIDPDIDWDSPIENGTVLDLENNDFLNIVVLDSADNIVKVWQVVAREESSSSVKSSSSAKSSSSKESSSSSKEKSSSSEKNSSSEESSSSEKSSSSEASSSSEEQSSSSEEESSSSVEPESSSVEPESSSAEESSSSAVVEAVKLSDFAIEGGQIQITDDKIYVEMKYGANLAKLIALPMDTLVDLRRTVEMEFADDSGNVATYRVVAGVQLPGSDFSARDDFWATTSDAMATNRTAALVTISSQANLSFDGGMATVSTQEVEGTLVFDGSWKMAGGFYFSGEYAGETALDIYEQGYTKGTPSTGDSYIIKDMTFGKPFTARPVAFELKYSYNHVSNTSSDYPQKSLVYVMLVGKNGKVVATGAFADDASTDMATRKVKLSYGKDPFGLLTDGYPVAEGLTLGKGDEDVVEIHVMFASSAYAHVVCGGMLGNSDKYRGGKNAALVLDNFKLIY